MNEIKEVTAGNLKNLRGLKGFNQDQMGEIIGLSGYHISNIEKGKRALSSSEKSLLDLYFFGKMPFEIVNQVLLKSVLEFTPLQWRVISILATKRGMTPGTWIADRIRTYLAFDKEAQETAAELEPGTNTNGLSLVAEEASEYNAGNSKQS